MVGNDDVGKPYDSLGALIKFYRIGMGSAYGERKALFFKLDWWVKILLHAAPSRNDGRALRCLYGD